MKEKLVVALDVPNYEEAEEIVKEVSEYVGYFKVGKQLFTAEGPRIFKMIKKYNGNIFADLKYHDIPNTVSLAARELVKQGVDMFNVHASGGMEMMKRTVLEVNEEAERIRTKSPIMLAVTVLTSLDAKDLKLLGIKMSVEEYILKLAEVAKISGFDGVVCSPAEIKLIKKNFGQDFITLTPGIRPAWTQLGDQKRVMTPREAITCGSDYLVIGRPITKAENRLAAVKRILKEMGGEHYEADDES